MSSAAAIAQSIPTRFAQIVARYPQRIAVSSADGQWTYAELDARANAVAAWILDRSGNKPEPVALFLSHGAPLLAAILGALKAGKLYLALDPSHPRERLASMLADSGAQLMLADEANRPLADLLASEQPHVLEAESNPSGSLTNRTLPEISAEGGAWLTYTSGSTGTPLGVWQNHRGVLHHADIYRELIQLTPDDRLSLLTSCSLAASGTNMFGALLNGATLCPFHVRSQGVEQLAAWLREERISVCHSVPTVIRHLARATSGRRFENLRLVRLGGEPMLRSDVEIFRQLCPGTSRLMNSFSSTETGLVSAFMIDRETVLPGWRVPVGHTARDVGVQLLNERNQPVRPGDEGTIAVRGAFLRQGYWRKPGLTAEKYQADPDNPQIRTFITDDLGRFLPDGSLEHLGRGGQTVKIRGQRVHLGEVEAALLATDLVREAAVTAPEEMAGERRLVAYFAPRDKANATPEVFRQALRVQLPEHMIPSAFVGLEKLPQTASGKIDRRALQWPARPEKKPSLQSAQLPRNAIEARLKRIWEAALYLSPIARTDDFFELGGTSLQSVEVLLSIEEWFNIPLPPSTLVEHSTIEKLSAFLANQVALLSPSPLVPLRDKGNRRPLFLIHTGQGDVSAFGLLARRLPDRPIYGLQSVGLQGECWPLMRVSAMARRYLPCITERDPTGPYFLAGACMGGLVALELAQLLVQQNRPVGLLALINTPHPILRWQQSGWKERLYCPARDTVRDAFRILRWLIVRGFGLGRRPRSLAQYRRFVANMNFLASRFYIPRPYPGTITIFASLEGQFPPADRRLLMRRYARDSAVVAIPGRRDSLYGALAVDELAQQLQIALELAERNTRP